MYIRRHASASACVHMGTKVIADVMRNLPLSQITIVSEWARLMLEGICHIVDVLRKVRCLWRALLVIVLRAYRDENEQSFMCCLVVALAYVRYCLCAAVRGVCCWFGLPCVQRM